MAKSKGLTQIGVQRLKESGLHSDGLGLYLFVKPTGAKSWVLRYMLNGRARAMGLGGYPDVTLAAAREKAASYRSIIKSGIDPLDGKREVKAKAQADAAKRITFSKAAHEYIESHKSGWKNAKHIDQWRNTIKTYAEPIIGALDVSLIENTHIVRIFQKDGFWNEKTESATRLRGRIEKILDWCAVQKFRSTENPARWKGNLEALLPAPNKVQVRANHPALPFSRMAEFFESLKTQNTTAALALQFTILTAARTDETIGARWEEIDFKEKIWTVPASRHKVKKEHRVPLTDAAIEILKAMAPQDSGLIFQGRQKNGLPSELSDNSINLVIKRMNQKLVDAGENGWMDERQNRVATTHGFRSSFKDWATEVGNYPNELTELALSHKIANTVEAAYRRGDMFEKRKALMSDWAKFCGVEK